MCNPAKHTVGLGFFLRKKRRPDSFTLINKVGFDGDTIGGVFYFFCDQNRGSLRGDGGNLPGPRPLWLARLAKVLMIAIENLMSESRDL